MSDNQDNSFARIPLGPGPSATEVALLLHPAAALIGDWLGFTAILAPQLISNHAACSGGGADGGAGVPADTGWWLGSIPYPNLPEDESPGNIGGFARRLLARDADGLWWYLTAPGAETACPQEWAEALCAAQLPLETKQVAGRGTPGVTWHAPDPVPHARAVAATLAAIAAGEIYQACICTQFTGTLDDGDALELFVALVRRTDAAKAAYLAGPDGGAIVSLSPEVFLTATGDAVTERPIKGTLPIDRDPAELRASVKDVAENIMIVDLVRNDLGRVAEVGSVRATELLAIEPAPGVWHLVSTVTAKALPHVGLPELLSATFPPASVTGTPKLAARSHIAAVESRPRGAYCGAIGIVGPRTTDGRWLDLSVAIRTITVGADGSLTLGVGGGITADSNPADEFAECLAKAAALIAPFA